MNPRVGLETGPGDLGVGIETGSTGPGDWSGDVGQLTQGLGFGDGSQVTQGLGLETGSGDPRVGLEMGVR